MWVSRQSARDQNKFRNPLRFHPLFSTPTRFHGGYGFPFSSERKFDFRFLLFRRSPWAALLVGHAHTPNEHLRLRGQANYHSWREPNGKLRMRGQVDFHFRRFAPLFPTPIRFPGEFPRSFNICRGFFPFSRAGGVKRKKLLSTPNARPRVR